MSEFEGIQAMLEGSGTPEWKRYLSSKKAVYARIDPQRVRNVLVSEANWITRSQCMSGHEMGICVRPGDVCYMDFGQAYLNEAGYQHFGLVLSLFHQKALVVPMTSNAVQYAHAYDPLLNPGGRRHLFPIGRPDGLMKESVLFLNDAKYINTARIIDVKAHIDPSSVLFREIVERVKSVMFDPSSLS